MAGKLEEEDEDEDEDEGELNNCMFGRPQAPARGTAYVIMYLCLPGSG